jgi:polar amino acid transport system substrate-binding protein
MKKQFLRSLFTAFLLFQFVPVASANAEELKVGASILIPPYVITDSDSGIELDIVKEALILGGYEPEFIYLPLLRVSKYLEQRKIGCGMSMSGDSTDTDSIYYSDSHITYQNAAITLKSQKLKISSLRDMIGKRVCTFQNAAKYLGTDFAEASEKGLKYREVSELNEFIPLLFQGAMDIVVADIFLFEYYRKNDKRTDTSAPVEFHKIFSPAMLKAGFTDKKIRDDFNDGVRHLRKTGRYDEIIRKYIY